MPLVFYCTFVAENVDISGMEILNKKKFFLKNFKNPFPYCIFIAYGEVRFVHSLKKTSFKQIIFLQKKDLILKIRRKCDENYL